MLAAASADLAVIRAIRPILALPLARGPMRVTPTQRLTAGAMSGPTRTTSGRVS